MYTDIIRYWFNLDLLRFRPEWFDGSIDKEIKERFGELHNRVENGEYDYWKDTKYGKLAYIIVLDQFTRNLFRDSDFRRNDKKVLELVEDMINKREDLKYLHFVERMFILLPLRHSKVSKNIRIVLEQLEEYKKGITLSLELQYLEKFKYSTIKDLTKATGEYNFSGGIDSMVLLQILKKILGKENVICGYVSHSNREVAQIELEFLIDWCNKLEVQLIYRKVDYMNRESVEREFYEEETRNIRFELYKNIVKEYNLDGVCLGHHRDDIGENVMMNILKGRDVVELKGMCDKKQMYGVTICRPMLSVKKDTVWHYGHTHNVSCFLDSTPDWSWRGVLRRKIYPLLDERLGSIHTLLAALGDKSEEWNTVIEKMVFNPIYEKVEYLKNGCIVRLDKVALEMPNSFFTKLLVHIFHSMNVRMISIKCLDNFLDWLKDTTSNTRCSLSNGYIAIKECSSDILVHLVKSDVLNKDKWKYSIDCNTDNIEMRKSCSWRDILKGEYVFTSKYNVDLVNKFIKSDKNRKLYKGFEFLPKLSSSMCVSNIVIKILY